VLTHCFCGIGWGLTSTLGWVLPFVRWEHSEIAFDSRDATESRYLGDLPRGRGLTKSHGTPPLPPPSTLLVFTPHHTLTACSSEGTHLVSTTHFLGSKERLTRITSVAVPFYPLTYPHGLLPLFTYVFSHRVPTVPFVLHLRYTSSPTFPVPFFLAIIPINTRLSRKYQS